MTRSSFNVAVSLVVLMLIVITGVVLWHQRSSYAILGSSGTPEFIGVWRVAGDREELQCLLVGDLADYKASEWPSASPGESGLTLAGPRLYLGREPIECSPPSVFSISPGDRLRRLEVPVEELLRISRVDVQRELSTPRWRERISYSQEE